MWTRRANLLLHIGFGECHGDLMIADGERCRTIRLQWRGRRWIAHAAPSHRRRYLSVAAGAIAGGRGRVMRCWHGLLRIHRIARGWRLYFDANHFIDVGYDALAV